MRMKYQTVSVIYIAIFIVPLLKGGRPTPVNSGTELMEDKPDKDKKRPSMPPWAKANGLGKQFLLLLNTVRLYSPERIRFTSTIAVKINN